MKKVKSFYCIFPPGQNVHLIKDVGMIPFMLCKEGFYDSTISFYAEEEQLTYLRREVKGLKYEKIRKIFKNENFNIFIFLLKNFRKMNVVMMFHPTIQKILIVWFFKFFTFNRIKFYFKLDSNESIFKTDYNKNSFKNRIKKIFYKHAALYTVENMAIVEFLEGSFMNALYLPNGFYNASELSHYSKEKVFLTVGRIGTYEKYTENLLEALTKVNLNEWRVEIVGPYDLKFQIIIDDFFYLNPNLKDKVNFVGAIEDRKLLDCYYSKSSVFILTSRLESFGIVLVEALAKGNFLVSSNLLPAREITKNEKYGTLFPIGDSNKLAQILQEIIDGKAQLPNPNKLVEFAEENYNWKNIVRNLYKYISDHE